ncbi:MAG: hypothetical protein GVY07_12200 [Bacteroidetes bacterium]|nr:hypothetical protein [Bacteroidota bacterium]
MSNVLTVRLLSWASRCGTPFRHGVTVLCPSLQPLVSPAGAIITFHTGLRDCRKVIYFAHWRNRAPPPDAPVQQNVTSAISQTVF